MVIPNKSTIAEEEIQVPYGRDSHTRSSDNIRDSVVTDVSGVDNIGGGLSKPPTGLNALASPSVSTWDRSPVTPLQGGLSALAANFKGDSALDDEEDDTRSGLFDSSTGGGKGRSGSGSSNTTRKLSDARGVSRATLKLKSIHVANRASTGKRLKR